MNRIQHCCHEHVIGCLSGMPSAPSYCYQATSAAEKVVQPWPAGEGAENDLDKLKRWENGAKTV